jgi:radical SAM-linked protein
MYDSLERTGYEEVSLVSLSTCDYTQIGALLDRAAGLADARNTALSLPSLRLDTRSVALADTITGARRSGLTFAPEAATPRLRAVINKAIPDDVVLDAAAEAFARGWGHVKCYFMIGLPTETDEDVQAIADLCLRMLDRGKAITPHAKVATGVSTFVPKPFTPFQWAGQIGIEETRRRQGLLARRFRKNPGIKYGRHEPRSTFVEGLLARGDRRAADLVEAAFRRGARFETDANLLDVQAWQAAVEETGYDVDAAFAARPPDARLPWDHIDALVTKSWLQQEWGRALSGETLEDCRRSRCTGCGAREHAPAACDVMLERVHHGESAETTLPDTPPREEPPPSQRIRFRIGRHGEARFLSHLECAAAWVRALRRAGAPLSYSQGFHAHPKVTFAAAPPVGEESDDDYMDVLLRERVDPNALRDQLKATLPGDFAVYDAADVPVKAPSLMSTVTGFAYTIDAAADPAQVKARVEEVLAAPALPIERKGRPSGRRRSAGSKTVDLRPVIRDLAVTGSERDKVTIEFTTVLAGGVIAKPREIVTLLGLDPAAVHIVKRATHFRA